MPGMGKARQDQRGLPPHAASQPRPSASRPAPDRFQAAGCPVPIECGQQGLILGQLQGLAVALGRRLVVLKLEVPVPFLLQLHSFGLCHLSGRGTSVWPATLQSHAGLLA